MPIFSSDFERRLRAAIAITAVGAGSATSCVGETDLPTPPDVSGLIAKYTAPTRAVTALEAPTEAINGGTTLDFLRRAGLDQYFREATAEVGKREQEQIDVGNDLRFSFGVLIDQVCRGWDPLSRTPNRDRDGHIVLNGVVRQNVADPIAWGNAERCRLRVGTPAGVLRGVIDGAVTVYVYGGLSANISDSTLLVHVQGTIGTETQQLSGDFDFRVSKERLETRVVFADGTFVIVGLGTTSLEVRGINGIYRCDLRSGRCVLPTTAVEPTAR